MNSIEEEENQIATNLSEEDTKMVLYRVNEWEKEHDLIFKAGDAFYTRVGINRKRWGMLVTGDVKLFAYEARVLAQYFKVSITDFIYCQPKGTTV